ncbi:MAG: hypothetical protein ACPHCJ_01395 [Oceanococcaceae bacterium]
MRRVVPSSAISRIVKEIGGTFRISGEEGIAAFGDVPLANWVREFGFEVGSSRTILMGEQPISRASFRSSGNRLDPRYQDEKKRVLNLYNLEYMACIAMTTYTARNHGRAVEAVLQEIAEKHRGFDHEDSGIELCELRGGWGLLVDRRFKERTMSIETPNGWTWQNVLDAPTNLVKDGAIYIPVAEHL